MAFKYTDLVWRVTEWSDSRFTHFEKTVLNALATRADENGKCFPGFTCLNSDTGISKGRISEAIENLKELGLVEVEVGHRGAFRYSLDEETIIAFGRLEEKAQEAESKAKAIRGKNGKTYTRKAEVAPRAEAAAVPAETFNKLTCPKCEVTSMMTQQAYAKHIAICPAKPKAVPPPPVPPPAPEPQPVIVECPMPHCNGSGPESGMEVHMATLKYVCYECKAKYHTSFEKSACEQKHWDEYNAERRAQEEARWAALTTSQRYTEWTRDRDHGMRSQTKVWGCWHGEKTFPYGEESKCRGEI